MIGTTNDKKDSITKEEIAKMEIISFEGKIEVVDTEDKVQEAVSYLEQCETIGFDTETRPSFQKGRTYKISLMQLSDDKICFLFRLNRIGVPESLLNLLKNEKIKKIGLSLRDDFNMLRKVYPAYEPNGFIELQNFVKQYNIQEQSLQKIYAILFRKKISKSQRLSNWDIENLSESQKKYAATDAWACIEIYKELKNKKAE